MKRIIVSLIATGILTVGAFAAVAITGNAASAQSDETAESSEVDRPTPYQDVLDDLVADGTLTQAQADAVKEALKEKFEELEPLREERRDRIRDRIRKRHHIRHLLDDGVISADEIAELPDDHPFKDPDGPLADALADGEITREELEASWEERKAAG